MLEYIIVINCTILLILSIYNLYQINKKSKQEYVDSFKRVLIDISEVRRGKSQVKCEIVHMIEREMDKIADNDGYRVQTLTSLLELHVNLRPGDMIRSSCPFAKIAILYINGIAMKKETDFIIENNLFIWNGDFLITEEDFLQIQE